MRIAFLCKRIYSGKDVINDRFGRLYELPKQLALLGHDVQCFCLDYHGNENDTWIHDGASGTLRWESYSAGPRQGLSLAGLPSRLLNRLKDFAPNILIGASDIPHIILTRWLSRKLDLPYAVDLYDNFESFGQARIPGFKLLLAQAVRDARLVIAVSQPLKQKVMEEYAPHSPVLVMPNSIDSQIFKPGQRALAREQLGLPANGKLIGTAGGLSRMKGIQALYAAWPMIEATVHDAHLILAGSIETRFPPPSGPRVHFLGSLPQEQVASLFNALDVGVVTVENTDFGRYCFPQKAYEMMACDLPIVAADIGVMRELLAETPRALYPTGDAAGLANAVIQQILKPTRYQLRIPEWPLLVSDIEQALTQQISG